MDCPSHRSYLVHVNGSDQHGGLAFRCCCCVVAQAGPPGRARLAGELREMDQDILKLTRSLAVSV